VGPTRHFKPREGVLTISLRSSGKGVLLAVLGGERNYEWGYQRMTKKIVKLLPGLLAEVFFV
jgi:hypothetical protein